MYIILWLLLGIGHRLQVVASLSLSEILILSFAPFIFMKYYAQMRKDGVMTFFILSIFVVIGCAVSSYINHTHPALVLRGMATTCLISCSIVFSHYLLRKNLNGFKWFLLGSAVSNILNVFIFQDTTEVYLYGGDVDLIMEGPIFWIKRLGAIVMLPTMGWYLKTPYFVNIGAPLFMAIFSVITSSSGRAAALVSLGFVTLVLFGGKSKQSMMRIARNFWKIAILSVVLIFGFHSGYHFLAINKILNEKSIEKYEAQTEGDKGILRLLIGGRGEAFIGLLACRDNPIVGLGPWAEDTNGYTDEFFERFGTAETYRKYYAAKLYRQKKGLYGYDRLDCHSHITQFWAWFGIFGLFFWIYVLFVFVRYLKQDVFVVPQWYAWVACSIPLFVWDICFSPFHNRVGTPMVVVACLLARSIRMGRIPLQDDMIAEIKKIERR